MTGNNEEQTAAAADGDEMDDVMDLNEGDVIRYLLTHPDFLVDHIEILRHMAPREKWTGEGVVDLQSVLIDRSQEAIDDLRSAAQNVIETSRSNMSVQSRAHAAVLAVLETENFDDIVRVVTQEWPHTLDVDVVALGFEFSRAPFPALVHGDIRQLPLGTIRQLLGADLNVRLFDEMIDDGTIFGEGAGLAHTAALARLEAGFEMPPGLLALGAREDTFGPGQGTELIAFLSSVLAITVRQCLTRRS